MTTRDALRCHAFFHALDDAQLDVVARLAEQDVVRDPRRPGADRDFLVGHVGAGEAAGISALSEPHLCTAEARANGVCRLVRIGEAELLALCAADATLACRLLNEAARTALRRLTMARVELAASRI
jgi:hypothetical protein